MTLSTSRRYIAPRRSPVRVRLAPSSARRASPRPGSGDGAPSCASAAADLRRRRRLRSWCLGIATNEKYGGDREGERAVRKEEQPARPWREAVRAVGQREDLAARFAREILTDRVVPACRQDVHE